MAFCGQLLKPGGQFVLAFEQMKLGLQVRRVPGTTRRNSA
jgi:hypothetical protein